MDQGTMVDKETREELQQLERKLDYEKKFVEFRNEEREEAEKGKTTADGEDEDDFYIPEGLIDIPDVELEDLTEEKLVEIVQKIVSVSDRNPNEGLMVVCYGKRRSGKSFFLRHLMYLLRERWPFGLVMTNTSFNGYWQHHVPDRFVYQDLDLETMERLLNYQGLMTKSLTTKKELRKLVNPEKFVVLDDIVHNTDVKWHPVVTKTASQGRHYNQDIFVTLQYSKGMNPCWRSNSDIVAVFQQISEPQSHALWEEYGFPLTWPEWKKMLAKYTNNNRFIIINNTVKSNRIEQRFYTFRARDPGPFILGCKEYWECGVGKNPSNKGKLRDVPDLFTGRSAPS